MLDPLPRSKRPGFRGTAFVAVTWQVTTPVSIRFPHECDSPPRDELQFCFAHIVMIIVLAPTAPTIDRSRHAGLVMVHVDRMRRLPARSRRPIVAALSSWPSVSPSYLRFDGRGWM